MQIQKVTAHAFGHLKDQSLPLADGLTVIYGPNEAGKSTWHAALLAALCGRWPARARDEPGIERRRPWSGLEWVVSAQIRLADGRRVELRHDLQARHGYAKDLDIGVDYSREITTSGRDVPDAARWLGLDRRAFVATACVRQAHLVLATEDASGVRSYVERAAATAPADETAAAALARIEAFHREQVGTERSTTRPLPVALRRRAEAESALAEARAGLAAIEEQAAAARRLRAEAEAALVRLRRREAAAAQAEAEHLRSRVAQARELAEALDAADARGGAATISAAEVAGAIESWRLTVAMAESAESASGEPASASVASGEPVSAELTSGEPASAPAPLAGFKPGGLEPAQSGPPARAGVAVLAASVPEQTRPAERVTPADPAASSGSEPARPAGSVTGAGGSVPSPSPARSGPDSPDGSVTAEVDRPGSRSTRVSPAGVHTPPEPRRAVRRRSIVLLVGAAVLAVGAAVLFATGSPGPAAVVGVIGLVVGAIGLVGWGRATAPVVTPVPPAPPTDTAPSWAEQQRELEQQRLAEERRLAQERRLIEQQRELEQRRLAEERRLIEKQRELEQRRRAEQRRELAQRRIAAEQRVLAVAGEAGIDAERAPDAVRELEAWLAAERDRQAARERSAAQRARLEALLDGASLADLDAEAARASQRAAELMSAVDGDSSDVDAEGDVALLREQHQAAERRAVLAEQTLADLQRRHTPVAEAEERLAAAEVECRRLQALDDVLTRTRQFLSRAQERVHRDIAPQLSAALARDLAAVTAGRYTEAVVDPGSLAVRVRQSGGALREVEDLSLGTVEQVYLLLRVALAERLVRPGESCPLLLDDVTVHADQERTRRLLEVLLTIAERHQVVLFTQQEQVREWARANLTAPRHALHELSTLAPA